MLIYSKLGIFLKILQAHATYSVNVYFYEVYFSDFIISLFVLVTAYCLLQNGCLQFKNENVQCCQNPVL